MKILLLRTDSPQAELALYDDATVLAEVVWQADRQLAETIHHELDALLDKAGSAWSEVQAIAVYRGPGSFTGLRIGISVANALAYALAIPIYGAKGDDWRTTAVQALASGADDGQVVPEYGAPVHITAPRK